MLSVAHFIADKNPPPNAKLVEDLKSLAAGLVRIIPAIDTRTHFVNNVWISCCYSCTRVAIWVYDRIIYPPLLLGPMPNADLPDEIKADFAEARSVLNLSPRAAAALLRLCIQKLCIHLGQPGKDLNADIGALVKEGLTDRVQKALDVVRVIGNHAVHPGRIDLKDDQSTATKLFELVNMIAEIMITQPNQLDAMFDALPDGAKNQIARRDQ